jgi:hypothetical protein
MEKTASQILTEAADLLELEEKGRWGKGNYFVTNTQDSAGPACIMCAHGAIAYCGNPNVRSKVKAQKHASAGVITAMSAGAIAAASPFGYKSRQKTADRNGITLEQHIRNTYSGEIGLAHYRAAKVGLTFDFNDKPGRTKQEVIDKLREAALQSS